MNKSVHAIGRDLVRLIEDTDWPNEEASSIVDGHMYDYFDGLIIDLEEWGLPSTMTLRILVRAALTVHACHEGKLEATKSFAAAITELISDENLPA